MPNNLNISIGVPQSVEKSKNGVKFTGKQFSMELVCYIPNVIRVNVYPNTAVPRDFSYAVIAEPQQFSWTFTEESDSYLLETDELILSITKDPLRLSFYDQAGNLLNEDDPAFGHSWIGNEATMYKKLQEKERFIGLGEKANGLDRRGQAYVNWNTDAFAYTPDTDPLYATIPFYIGIYQKQVYGLFLDNTYKSRFNFGAANDRFVSISVDDGPLNYYFINGETVADIIKTYTALTGHMELPPLWALGFQQCRYSYYPESEVLNLAQTFRERKIPLDVLYFDIHYMDEYKVFTWDKSRFPDPSQMLKKLQETYQTKTVIIFDPGIKVQQGYEPYETAKADDLFVKYPDGTYYTADVWPGSCHFPDFTNPKVRTWWQDQVKDVIEDGIDGFWNDMNEPAVWGKEVPDLIEFDFEGERASHKKTHNVYGMQMARATYEATQKYQTDKRSFVLTRAAYAGIQRYSALWTGDNTSNDDSMLVGCRMVNSLGLSGVPFSGYDVGGFMGDASPDLFARWISIGAFAPFFRAHTMINSRSCEPWSFGERVEEISRNYINLRYRLLPYLYAVFYEASQTGMPVSRSLTLDNPFEDKIYQSGYDNEYLLGPAFLICPIESCKQLAKFYLPKGEWYLLYKDTQWTGEKEIIVDAPLDELPIFVKGGSIVPMQSLIQSTEETPEATLFLHLYKGNTDNDFVYYEDDGYSYAYKSGQYYRRNHRYLATKQCLILEEKEGDFESKFKNIKLYLHGFSESELSKLCLNQKAIKTASENYRFIEPISDYDPWEKNDGLSKTITDLPFVEFANDDAAIKITWA